MIKKISTLLIGITALFAVIMQFRLMFEITTVNTTETTIRFFSYFTILTNSLVAIYFLQMFWGMKLPTLSGRSRPALTAITVYIIIVGLIYQVILRPLWQPEGIHKLVDELLHSVIPLSVLIYWIAFGRTHSIAYAAVGKWLLYPLFYLAVVMTRGYFSKFYPYPFLDVTQWGYANVFLNVLWITALFAAFMVLLIYINNRTAF